MEKDMLVKNADHQFDEVAWPVPAAYAVGVPLAAALIGGLIILSSYVVLSGVITLLSAFFHE
jgi:hypothetical protein